MNVLQVWLNQKPVSGIVAVCVTVIFFYLLGQT